MKLKGLILLLFVSGSLHAQDYYHRIIPFHIMDVYPGSYLLFKYNNEILIGTLVNNDISTLIRLDQDGTNVRYRDIEDFSFSIMSHNVIDDNLYLFGKDRKIENNLLLLELDELLDETNRSEYDNIREYSFPMGSVSIDESIFLASFHRHLDNNRLKANIKKVDLDGNIIWDKEFQPQNSFTAIRDMYVMGDNNMLISVEVGEPGYNGRQHDLIKMDTSGNTIWTYTAEDMTDFGLVNQVMAHLSNENTVINSVNDRRFDLGYGPGELFPFPPHLIWVDRDGQFVKDTLLQSEFNNFLYLDHLKPGKGDYFFGYGNWRDPITEKDYSWLFKMNNDGEMLWNKRYQHPDLADNSNTMTDIIEEENGDIIALSLSIGSGEPSKIVLMKVNKNGCFGDAVCPDELNFTDVYDIDISTSIQVFPNPTSSTITLESEYHGQLALFDMQGHNLLQIEDYYGNKPLDVSNINRGLVTYRFVTEKGVGVGTFVIK